MLKVVKLLIFRLYVRWSSSLCFPLFQKPWKARDPWPIEAADSHYLIGQCNMEMRNYVDALEAFTNAIKLNPNMAEVLHFLNVFVTFRGKSFFAYQQG